MGTGAVTNPELVDEVAGVVAVAVGLDHRDGELAVHGWTESAGVKVWDVLDRYRAASAFVITEIGRDGMLTGPDVDGLARAAGATDVPVIASGGVSSLDDVRALSRIVGLGGIITGKAIYEGRFDVAQALSVLAESSCK
jgi:phosphoribosylformimino-5-aminoimidazole carboxamide ribotide isomerase